MSSRVPEQPHRAGGDSDGYTREVQRPDVVVLRTRQYGEIHFGGFGHSLRECDEVALASLSHIGKSYRITRELVDGYIDCSTVVSQSHWVGGAVQTPFIADSQLKAVNASDVSTSEPLPGDSIYAYRSARDSPGRRYNHVALVIGPDSDGRLWAIESSDPIGVRLTPVDDLRSGGGIRRFCPNPRRIFAGGEWRKYVEAVPKLGRLGSRLTANYHASERMHRGTDIYCADSSLVVAPLSGEIIGVERVRGVVHRIHLYSDTCGMMCTVGPLEPLGAIAEAGSYASVGMILGRTTSMGSHLGCNCMLAYRRRQYLHVELWDSTESMPSPAPGLSSEIARRVVPHSEFRAVSPIYAMKLGLLNDCFSR